MALPAQRALAGGLFLWVEHDADRLALVCRAGGLCAGGGCGEQLGEQGVFLAHGLVGDHGHFTVARRGDQGDHATTLEKAQDAP